MKKVTKSIMANCIASGISDYWLAEEAPGKMLHAMIQSAEVFIH